MIPANTLFLLIKYPQGIETNASATGQNGLEPLKIEASASGSELVLSSTKQGKARFATLPFADQIPLSATFIHHKTTNGLIKSSRLPSASTAHSASTEKELISMKKNREEDFYSLFKPLRNRLRKYSPESILYRCIKNLYQPTQNQIEKLQKHPWIQILLIKLVFIDDEAEKPGRPPIPDLELLKSIQHIYDLSNLARMPSDYEDISLFMRAIAYQQFPYQIQPRLDDLGRQDLLFSKVQNNHFFNTAFQEANSISPRSFLRLALCLLSHFQETSSPIITHEYLSTLKPIFTQLEIDSFLNAISISIEKLPHALRESEGKKRSTLEYYQQTPFIKHPLIRKGRHYCCISPEILQICLGHYIYDSLKKINPTKFHDTFGRRFESYVGELIKNTNLNFATEKELEEFMPGNGKLVDYLIVDGETNIFIDAKAVEMADRGKTAHLRDVVHGATKTSLIKALKQGQEICSRIHKLKISHPTIRPRNNNFLIAVTYKELYIGNGLFLSCAVGQNAINRIIQDYPEDQRIPIENVYFLSIDEFELLISISTQKNISITEILERAKASDKNPATRKFIFSMHLRDWPEHRELLSPLQPTIESMIHDIKKDFPAPSNRVG